MTAECGSDVANGLFPLPLLREIPPVQT